MLILLSLSAQLVAAVPSDTPPPAPRPRVQAVEVSDWYARRLTLHRWFSYASYPVFAFQYAAGQQVWEKGSRAPEWARRGHRIGAATLAGIFAVNTVTGAWNLVESRGVQEGRARRYVHAASMLLADAGFTWAGAVLSEQAERSSEKRRMHRTVALTSIGISVASATAMLIMNR
jgi:hypothetical protein